MLVWIQNERQSLQSNNFRRQSRCIKVSTGECIFYEHRKQHFILLFCEISAMKSFSSAKKTFFCVPITGRITNKLLYATNLSFLCYIFITPPRIILNALMLNVFVMLLTERRVFPLRQVSSRYSCRIITSTFI